MISVRTAEKEEIEEVLYQITKEIDQIHGLLKEKAERADILAEVIQELMPDEWKILTANTFVSYFTKNELNLVSQKVNRSAVKW